jgi:integrase
MASVFKRGGKANRGGAWYAAWKGSDGKRKTKCTGTTDKSAAERIAAKFEAEAALRREGVIDAQLEGVADQARRSIESHLADYEAKLAATSKGGYHVHSTLKAIRDCCEAAGFRIAADIAADGVNHFAAKLRTMKQSARSIQFKIGAIKGFAKWLSATNKLPRNPLESVEKPNPDNDRRYERRMLLPAEWSYLRTHAKGERFGISAAERVLLYATAIQTGLRSSELRSLTPGKLFLTGDKPYLVCKAGNTKNAKEARQYVRPDLAEALRKHVAGKRGSAVFKMPDPSDVSAMFKADLVAARMAWIDEAKADRQEQVRRGKSDFLHDVNQDGEVLDFHSLRHTCGAWLAMAGAHPKAVQTTMRHSAITLTMDTYGHLFPGQEFETVSLLPTMLSEASAQRQAQRAGIETRQDRETPCEALQDEPQTDSRRKVFLSETLDDALRDVAVVNESAPRWTRTNNPLIKSQMLCQLS